MKESIKSKDGKRKLYFSIDMKNFITYLLDQNTTCDKIYQDNKSSIESKLSELNNNQSIELSNFDFYLIDLKEIKKTPGYFLPKIKLNRNILIYNFLQNQKTILCFLPTNPISLEQGIKPFEDRIKISNEKLLEMRKNYLSDKTVDNIFNNREVFLYDYETKIFNKAKATLNEMKFTVQGKTDIIIYIQDIISIDYCDVNHPLIGILSINGGFKPSFYIVLKSKDNQWIIGIKREEKFNLLKSGFEFAFFKFNVFQNDINFNNTINYLKNSIAQKEEKYINSPIHLIKEENLKKLVKDILIYKKMILNNNYDKAKEKLDEIIKNCKEENKNEKSNFKEFITDEKISQYINASNKFSEIKIEENNDSSKDLLKRDLFDDLIEEINKLYKNHSLKQLNQDKDTNDTNEEAKDEKYRENIISYNLLLDYNEKPIDTLLEL